MLRAPLGSSWLEYELIGDGAPVLLIMGMGATRAAWQGQVEALRGGHQLLTFDNRGIGGSGPLQGRISIRSMAQDTLALLDHVGWERAHVVGISLGGMIAQELSLAAKDRVRSLTLITTHAGSRGPGPFPTPRGLSLFTRQRIATMRGDDHNRVELLLRLLFPPSVLAGEVGDRARAHIGDVFAGKQKMSVLQAQTVAAQLHHTRTRLKQLEGLSTLVIRSARDELVHPKAQSRLHRAIPGARLLDLHDAGHGALAQYGAEIAQAIADHVASEEA